MGSHRRDAARGRLTSPLVAQVVPAVPAFAVDDGFAYAVPPDLEGEVAVGSLVRVPLSGRRVRGYVVGLRRAAHEGLKPIATVSGNLAVFDDRMLQTLRWAAIHYVAPLAAVLAKTAPPNVPRRRAAPQLDSLPDVDPSPVPLVTGAAAAARHPRTTALVGPGPWVGPVAAMAAPVLAAARSVLVVNATLEEAAARHRALVARFGNRVLLGASGLEAKDATASWSAAAAAPGRILVGTRETAFWPVAGLGLAVVVEDGRRGMKDKATPTTHVRDVLRRRAGVERFGLVFAGPVPTAETVGAGADLVEEPGRAWPLVEVADRGEEPPGGGFLLERSRQALRGLVHRGGTALVFTHRRGYAPAFACTRCRTIRRCPKCGARPDPGTSCLRCGASLGSCLECGGGRFQPLGAAAGRILDELRRVVGKAAGPADSDAPVRVVTERDLVGVKPVDLAVVVDADGLILAPHYRAEEDALRLLARVALTVARGSGRRCLVQTAMPGHEVMGALRRGDALPFLQATLERRRADGFPPAGELLVVETQGEGPDADASLRAATAGRATVLGPATVRGRSRWLVQGPELRTARIALRRIITEWREAGTRVRIDADPVDL